MVNSDVRRPRVAAVVERLRPRLTRDQHTGGDVPGQAGEHHRDIEAPGGQPRQVEALGAVHAYPQAARHQALHQLAMDVVLDLRAGPTAKSAKPTIASWRPGGSITLIGCRSAMRPAPC